MVRLDREVPWGPEVQEDREGLPLTRLSQPHQADLEDRPGPPVREVLGDRPALEAQRR